MSIELWALVTTAFVTAIGTGIAWGLQQGKTSALETRVGKLEESSESMNDMRALQGDAHRHEVAIQTLARHLGEVEQQVAVLDDRAARPRRDPT